MKPYPFLKYSVVLCLLVLFGSCSIKPVMKKKNLVFSPEHNLKLDVYAPKRRHIKEPRPVLLFVHGGNWRHGKRSTYFFYGKGMARKGIVAVVADYRLSDSTNNEGMATDLAMAVQWSKEHISEYGGDPNKIYLSGHSAGAQLVALVATDNSYFEKLGMKNPVKGAILIDGFGMDMHTYLSISKNRGDTIYKPTFGLDTAGWKRQSATTYLHRGMPPFQLFTGGKTMPVIHIMNNLFLKALLPYQPDAHIIVIKGKGHVPMITQFFNPNKKIYKDMIGFMK